MPEDEARVLVVEDDKDFRDLLVAVLSRAHYQVETAGDGFSALEKARRDRPDLILLDVMLPDLSGFEVCRQLRKLQHLRTIPIIMLTAMGRIEDKLKGIEAGADDYLTKPVAIPELLARVKMHLRRSQRERMINPLSGLPGNPEIEKEIRLRLQEGQPFGIAYIDLNRFKEFNDRFGFLEGDRVIRALADLLVKAISQHGDPAVDFIGHIGGDDFVIIVRPHVLERVVRYILDEFGRMAWAPELSISIVGGVIDLTRSIELETLIRYLADLKRKAKQEGFPLLLSNF
ncbi:response regulator [Thermoflexus sp.]|uniref:GGDEF domain-containing response regulator n=1 Tax=Thermoflexus sp. TaxID=1969742 RepID=UPI0035E4382F